MASRKNVDIGQIAKKNTNLVTFVHDAVVIYQAKVFNPFAPEPPVTARADPGPFYPL